MCVELHGHYLFRLCGSIIRISSTCYPGLRVCVFVCVYVAQILPQVFLLILSQHRGVGGYCVLALKPVLLHSTLTHPHTHQKETDIGQCQTTRELEKFQSHDIFLGFYRWRKPGKSWITRSILARYSEKETRVWKKSRNPLCLKSYLWHLDTISSWLGSTFLSQAVQSSKNPSSSLHLPFSPPLSSITLPLLLFLPPLSAPLFFYSFIWSFLRSCTRSVLILFTPSSCPSLPGAVSGVSRGSSTLAAAFVLPRWISRLLMTLEASAEKVVWE